VGETHTRADLLELELERWVLLEGLLDDVAAARANDPTLTPEGWSVRDLVWHMARWNDVVATQLESMHAGTFDERFDWNTEENNARFLASGRSVTYEDARAPHSRPPGREWSPPWNTSTPSRLGHSSSSRSPRSATSTTTCRSSDGS